MNLKNLVSLDSDPDVGQTFYLVDADYRTIAQGWSRGDGTGPLDLAEQRNPGYVYYAGSNKSGAYATDAAAAQALINAMVDYRGDKGFLTPGSYSIGTALAMDVPGMRWMGPKRHVRNGLVTVTATVDAAYTVSVDDVEIAHHKVVPLTAANFLDLSSGADRGHLHHLYWDASGIATSTSTEFCNGTTNVEWLVEHCAFYADDEQGDAFTLTSSQRWMWQDCEFYVGLTGVAWASVMTFTTSALGNIVRRSIFRGCGGATPAVFTNLFTGVANVNGQLMFLASYVDGTALSTGTDIETTFGTATDIEIADIMLTGDATTEAGTLITLA